MIVSLIVSKDMGLSSYHKSTAYQYNILYCQITTLAMYVAIPETFTAATEHHHSFPLPYLKSNILVSVKSLWIEDG